MAVAGFSENDLEIVAKENLLTVQGRGPEADEAVYLHRGIGRRVRGLARSQAARIERLEVLLEQCELRGVRAGLTAGEEIQQLPTLIGPQECATIHDQFGGAVR